MTDATLSDTTSVQTFSATEGNSTGQQVLATFSDANPSAPLSDYTATVNWGGTLVGPATTSIQLISRTATASTWEVLGTATYSEEGTYTVSVSVSDVDGSHTSTSNTTFSVTDATLSDTTSVQTFNATEGNSTGQQVLATFSDANPSAPMSDYTATVNWGGTLVGPATTSIQLISRTATASTWEVLGTATYSEEGTYTVSVSVSDVDGSHTSTSNTTFSVTDATLSDTTSVQTFNATEGNSTGQQVLATFSDANPSAPLSDYTATVNWGGTLVGPATTSIQLISRTATASTWEVLGTATYSEEGTLYGQRLGERRRRQPHQHQ